MLKYRARRKYLRDDQIEPEEFRNNAIIDFSYYFITSPIIERSTEIATAARVKRPDTTFCQYAETPIMCCKSVNYVTLLLG